VGGDRDRAAFVGCGDEPEQQLAAGVVEWGEADLVNDDQVVAAYVLDGFANGVVSDSAVEVFDELDGGEVADLVSGGDGYRNFNNYRRRLLLGCGIKWTTIPTRRIRGRQPAFAA
jgi:hypothetical protein